jgi:hypothetical protein
LLGHRSSALDILKAARTHSLSPIDFHFSHKLQVLLLLLLLRCLLLLV